MSNDIGIFQHTCRNTMSKSFSEIYFPMSSILSSLCFEIPSPRPQQFKVNILTSASISSFSLELSEILILLVIKKSRLIFCPAGNVLGQNSTLIFSHSNSSGIWNNIKLHINVFVHISLLFENVMLIWINWLWFFIHFELAYTNLHENLTSVIISK